MRKTITPKRSRSPSNPYTRPARRAVKALDPLERAREDALRHARALVRAASKAIRGLHRGRWDASDAQALARERERLDKAVRAHPGLGDHGAVIQAYGEFAEAHLLHAYRGGEPVPDAARLGVPPAGYLLGLGDLVGELRRVTLDRLRLGDAEEAEQAFDAMQKAYEALEESQAPEGVVPLRAKVDAARALVERTRGDLVTGKGSKTLEKKIDGLARLLDEAEEGRGKPKPRRREQDDLDLDKAWGRS